MDQPVHVELTEDPLKDVREALARFAAAQARYDAFVDLCARVDREDKPIVVDHFADGRSAKTGQ